MKAEEAHLSDQLRFQLEIQRLNERSCEFEGVIAAIRRELSSQLEKNGELEQLLAKEATRFEAEKRQKDLALKEVEGKLS